MNREIKFRGKRVDGKGWAYGDYQKELGGHYILFPLSQKIEVHPESIGQLTPHKDKNGVDIYEGDIVKLGIWKYIIEYKYNGWAAVCFMYSRKNKTYEIDLDHEVIGNIHEKC